MNRVCCYGDIRIHHFLLLLVGTFFLYFFVLQSFITDSYTLIAWEKLSRFLLFFLLLLLLLLIPYFSLFSFLCGTCILFRLIFTSYIFFFKKKEETRHWQVSIRYKFLIYYRSMKLSSVIHTYTSKIVCV
jgi:hypothetical protein